MSETKSQTVAVCQLNLHVGDIAGNTQKIIDCAQRLQAQADILLFPELTITGYPPEDLLLRSECDQRVEQAVALICEKMPAVTLVIGYPGIRDGQRYNLAGVLRSGEVIAEYRKQQLPNYSVFDEKRYFVAGEQATVFEQGGLKFGLTICEDIWFEQPIAKAVAGDADIILNLNASPFCKGKTVAREQQVSQLANRHQTAIIYANLVGGQDDLVFDGASFAVNHLGELVARAPQYQEVDLLVDCYSAQDIKSNSHYELLDDDEEIYQALVCGVRDYVTKSGFSGAVLGLSGGIDSALTLAIAVDALGAENVEVVMMPSRYTADMSNSDAKAQADRAGVKNRSIPIEPAFDTFLNMLSDEFSGLATDATEENIQARCRGILLMAISNKSGRMLLTTGNKSEMSVGYATLYGDMAGGYAPLKDVPKQLVYRLSQWCNRDEEVIPQRVIDRPPSAELRPDQKDSDSLPDYDLLDAVLEHYVEEDLSVDDIVARGYPREDVERVTKMVDRNEYKRRQAPPGVKITQRAYGRDRRYPIVSKF